MKTEPDDLPALRLNYISHEEFLLRTTAVGGAHWESRDKRWTYFNKTIEILKGLNLKNETATLEVGTMGVPVIIGSHTLDFSKGWNYEGKSPTYLHDMRAFPWPIPDKRYQVFIALRVWQHLGDKQESCFREAKRIAKHIIMVIPEKYNNGYGVSPDAVTKWNDGVPPLIEDVGSMGKLYFI